MRISELLEITWLQALGVSTVHGQTFKCLGSDLIDLDTDKASDFTTEKCQQGPGEKQCELYYNCNFSITY